MPQAKSTTVNKKSKSASAKKTRKVTARAATAAKTGQKTKPKTVAKKTSTAKRKTAASSTKSTKATKTSVKSSVKQSAAKKSTAASKQPKTVQLPKRVSIRAREKVLVLANQLERDLYRSAVQISTVAGICFVAVGSAVSLQYVHQTGMFQCDSDCTAALLQVVDQQVLALEQATSTPVLSETPIQIEVIPLRDLPPSIDQPFELPLEIAQVAEITAYLFSTGTNGQDEWIPVQVSRPGNDKYVVAIPGNELLEQTYELKLRIVPADSDQQQLFTVGSFVGPKKFPVESSELTEPATNDEESEDVSFTADGEPVESDESEQKAEIVNEPNKDEPAQLVRAKVEEDAVDDFVAIESDNTAQAQLDAKPAATAFIITAPDTIAGVSVVTVEGVATLTQVEFYVRPLAGITTQSVGKMQDGEGRFRFNTTSLPNGSYELFAVGSKDGQQVQSNSLEVTLENERPQAAPTVQPDQEREVFIVAQALNRDEGPTEPLATIDTVAKQVAQDQLRSDSETLDELFTMYAAAQQTGDEALIAATKTAIDEYRDSVVTDALSDKDRRFIADDLDDALENKLSELQERVERFESVRRDRTNDDASVDSDKDGISDIDERLIFNTDPTVADTDGDGFTDGAEIAGGFDPLNVAAEAVIEYESPKEVVGVVVTEKLQIAEVVPDVVLANASSSERVQTVVRGVALPHSFVTLYVFSTPTIVTVKTDETGAFEYTFTKELEDGQHQVFAALTDNSGQIIAQSEGFSFVKEAQAFSFVDAQASGGTVESVASSDLVATDTSYRVVVGMAVLALGILLILLGLGLRANRPETEPDIVVSQS